MNIIGLDHLVITAERVEECIRFYTQILDMERIEDGGHLAFRFGQQKINVHRVKGEFQPAAKHVTYGSADLCLLAEGPAEAIYQELLSKGVEPTGLVPRTGARGPMTSLYLRDPDGNLIEIGVYG